MFDAELILIVEDEPLIALDLAETVTALGGRLVGPFSTVCEALENLASHAIKGAILDATLMGRDITPVALQLVERGIPLVVQSGPGLPPSLAALQPGLPVINKPATALSVASRLKQEMQLAATSHIDPLVCSPPYPPVD